MYVKNYMTSNPITIASDETISAALTLMNETNIHRIPVVQKGRLVGIITDGNIQKASPSKATSLSMYEINYLLSKSKVSDYMTRNVVTTCPECLLEEAVVKMKEHKVSCLPVMDNGHLVGIITETDLFDAFIDLLGFNRKGSRISIEIAEDRVGVITDLTGILSKENINIQNIAVYRDVDKPILVILRVDSNDKDFLTKCLSQEGYRIKHIISSEGE